MPFGVHTRHIGAVGIASTPAGYGGYWLVAADVDVFGFGVDFDGSIGGQRLDQPILGVG